MFKHTIAKENVLINIHNTFFIDIAPSFTHARQTCGCWCVFESEYKYIYIREETMKIILITKKNSFSWIIHFTLLTVFYVFFLTSHMRLKEKRRKTNVCVCVCGNFFTQNFLYTKWNKQQSGQPEICLSFSTFFHSLIK